MLKTVKVIPVPKKKDRSDPNNFRPISLLSVLSRPVHSHLSTFMEEHNLFHTLRSGCRSKYSYHTALSAMHGMSLPANGCPEIIEAAEKMKGILI